MGHPLDFPEALRLWGLQGADRARRRTRGRPVRGPDRWDRALPLAPSMRGRDPLSRDPWPEGRSGSGVEQGSPRASWASPGGASPETALGTLRSLGPAALPGNPSSPNGKDDREDQQGNGGVGIGLFRFGGRGGIGLPRVACPSTVCRGRFRGSTLSRCRCRWIVGMVARARLALVGAGHTPRDDGRHDREDCRPPRTIDTGPDHSFTSLGPGRRGPPLPSSRWARRTARRTGGGRR